LLIASFHITFGFNVERITERKNCRIIIEWRVFPAMGFQTKLRSSQKLTYRITVPPRRPTIFTEEGLLAPVPMLSPLSVGQSLSLWCETSGGKDFYYVP